MAAGGIAGCGILLQLVAVQSLVFLIGGLVELRQFQVLVVQRFIFRNGRTDLGLVLRIVRRCELLLENIYN